MAPDMYAMPPRSHSGPDIFQPASMDSTMSMFNDTSTVDTLRSETTAASSISSGQSPRLVDLLLPGTDLSATPPEYLSFRSQYPDSFYQPAFTPQPQEYAEEDEDIEEVVRQPPFNPDHEAWVMRLPSPSPSTSSSSSDESTVVMKSDPYSMFLQEPRFSAGSPEMLTLSFDRQTCGILSIRDGPTENPWRTLIWPLARDSPALFHALASMTSFHTSRYNPRLRVEGIDHMRSSIEALASGIQNMRVETAIATTLALAFSESWDQHISTGINHIKGAKILITKALTQHRRSAFCGEELTRIKFLCNSWIYMDVIARLTSVDDNESNDFEVVSSVLSEPFEMESQLDPLMGAASTLFPVIGRVANLVRRVRRSPSNSPAIISQAIELRMRLESWQPPDFFEDPEDPTTEVQHSIQTAEAYRWATLLYLHQAVPEIPSLSSSDLAKKVLVLLATVPMRSRAVVVQIYPLTAAGCEAVGEEDRQWVRERWQAMAQRMQLGIIDKAFDVVKEVWNRRDAYEAMQQAVLACKTNSLKRGFSMPEGFDESSFDWISNFGGGKRRATAGAFDLPRSVRLNPRKTSTDLATGEVDYEFTIKGRLHWLGVMRDWGWEVLLG
ncbi:hypothetical protein W97_05500 [Coniosporium apollinis CBS 100218]|uniref:Transcription factor domain-containing protein n=1 Tax=Coniosporium apollinis (strain CBS 100218) TaxID=1168221 RepID=R7YX33_CONA1|nr:uncharacterized protein W97_05500 [Coniosporium apollinis CBS 100218]EON66403.1 hypothetical protein W97_05500 [Coniosporium apollinis CBS 100218]